jgi:threonine aldolase
VIPGTIPIADLMTGCTGTIADAMDRAARRRPATMRDEDPDERALVREAADMLGMEAALFLPACTMANQVALRVWCNPGQTVLAEPNCHMAYNERRATALTAVVIQPVAGERGHLFPASLNAALNENPAPRLVWLEDTHMRAGGTVMLPDWTAMLGQTCRRHGIRLHLDGSRLPNAAAARGKTLAAAAAGAVTVSMSLNKALGAPLGALLAGPREMMDQAAQWREKLGGHWRPVGQLAVAARAALHGWEERLLRDYGQAAALSEHLRAAFGGAVSAPDTNIILVRCRPAAADGLVHAIGQRGVGGLAIRPDTVRLVMHGGVQASDLPLVAAAVTSAFNDAVKAT